MGSAVDVVIAQHVVHAEWVLAGEYGGLGGVAGPRATHLWSRSPGWSIFLDDCLWGNFATWEAFKLSERPLAQVSSRSWGCLAVVVHHKVYCTAVFLLDVIRLLYSYWLWSDCCNPIGCDQIAVFLLAIIILLYCILIGYDLSQLLSWACWPLAVIRLLSSYWL